MTQNLQLRPSTTPGAIHRARRPDGAHTETVLTDLGPTPPEPVIEPVTLREEGAV
ncbi:hypothetical protein ACWCRD_29760 [Streptomyces sp. NPDC002092]